MFKQQRLTDKFIKVDRGDSSSLSDLSDPEQPGKQVKVTQWTRVKAVHVMKQLTPQLFDIAKDLESDKSTTIARAHISGGLGQVLFHPDDFNGKGYDFSLEKHKLSQEELSIYGEMATKIRKRFELDHDLLGKFDADPNCKESLIEVVRSVKLNRNLTKFKNRQVEQPMSTGFETAHRISKKRNRRRHELRVKDLLAIISYWKENKSNLGELSTRFRIAYPLAAKLIKQYKTDPGFLARLNLKE